MGGGYIVERSLRHETNPVHLHMQRTWRLPRMVEQARAGLEVDPAGVAERAQEAKGEGRAVAVEAGAVRGQRCLRGKALPAGETKEVASVRGVGGVVGNVERKVGGASEEKRE